MISIRQAAVIDYLNGKSTELKLQKSRYLVTLFFQSPQMKSKSRVNVIFTSTQ